MRQVLLAAGVCVASLCVAPQATAQVRGRVVLEQPGTFRRVGRNVNTYHFRSQAYGLGSLGAGGGAGGGSVLRSGIASSPFSLRSSLSTGGLRPLRSSISSPRSLGYSGGLRGGASRSGPGAPGMGRPRAGGGRRPTDGGQRIIMFGGQDIRKAILGADPALSIAHSYLRAVGPASQAADGKATKTISSLIPSEPSQYTTLLAAGEKAFQAGRFGDAFNYFERAGYIAPRAPETLLSLLHARFATSSIAYATASHYLRQALKQLPELPLVPLKPKLFYGRDTAAVGRYAQHLDRLGTHLTKVPDDVDALLVLAYFRWFSGKTDETKAALATAMKIARDDNDEEMAEAIDTFWAAMVRTKKVSGEAPIDD